VIGAAAVLLAALPAVIASIPTPANAISATNLLSRIQQSQTIAFTGYAESIGRLGLPDTRQFSTLGQLFGDRSQMRIWWRDQQSWRLDTITVDGETDLHTDASGTWTWDYESNLASFSATPLSIDVRLPNAGDLNPASLGRRLLSQVRPAEISRLPTRRIAGQRAPGLRLQPGDSTSTIERVDVWASTAGVPLEVDVYSVGDSHPSMSTAFLDFDAKAPAEDDVRFAYPAGAQLRNVGRLDLATSVNRSSGATPPASLAGLTRNDQIHVGTIGVYGQGVTLFTAAALPQRTATSLRSQLQTATGLTRTEDGIGAGIGPLSLVLTDPDPSGVSWLLSGTVTLRTLWSGAATLRSRS